MVALNREVLSPPKSQIIYNAHDIVYTHICVSSAPSFQPFGDKMNNCSTFAITGFFKETNFEKPETRYTYGTNPQEAVGNLVAMAGDFKVLAIVSKDDLLATLKQLTTWESTQNARL